MAMSVTLDHSPQTFQWKPQPDAEVVVGEVMNSIIANSPRVACFADQLLRETATRLIDWIDHIALPASDRLHGRLERAGFVCNGAEPSMIWDHPLGLFPRIMTAAEPDCRLAVRVESLDDFLAAQKLASNVTIEGGPLQPLRKVRVAAENGIEFWAVERHGYRGWEVRELAASQIELVQRHADAFSRRPRSFEDDEQGFAQTRKAVSAAVAELGAGRASDLFFAAERAILDRQKLRGPLPKGPSGRAGPRLGEPRSSYLPQQPRTFSAAHRHTRRPRLPVPRTLLRRP